MESAFFFLPLCSLSNHQSPRRRSHSHSTIDSPCLSVTFCVCVVIPDATVFCTVLIVCSRSRFQVFILEKKASVSSGKKKQSYFAAAPCGPGACFPSQLEVILAAAQAEGGEVRQYKSIIPYVLLLCFLFPLESLHHSQCSMSKSTSSESNNYRGKHGMVCLAVNVCSSSYPQRTRKEVSVFKIVTQFLCPCL